MMKSLIGEKKNLVINAIKRLKSKAYRSYLPVRDYWFAKRLIRNNSHAPPDFMIIGTAKAGTTSLFQYLAQHPDIMLPTVKEINYFGMMHKPKGLKWYLKHFPLKEKMENKLTFEATPGYLILKNTPKQIAVSLPDCKFICILRDPVERAFSHWSFFQEHSKLLNRDFVDERSFADAVKEELTNGESIRLDWKYIEWGFYANQLKTWHRYFDEDQILIIDFEDLKQDPHNVLEEITGFLNIDYVYADFTLNGEKLQGCTQKKDSNANGELKTYNSTVYREKMEKETELFLRDYFKTYDEELEKLTGRKFSWMNK